MAGDLFVSKGVNLYYDVQTDCTHARKQKGIEEALAVPYDVLDDSGAKVASGVAGAATTSLPVGTYSVVIQATGDPINIPNVQIKQDGTDES